MYIQMSFFLIYVPFFYINSLNKHVQEKDLKMGVYLHFKQWGNVLSVKVLNDHLKRPYAFVQFEVYR